MKKPTKSGGAHAPPKPPKTDKPPQPWKPADATDNIRKLARGDFDFVPADHWEERLEERNLLVGDVLYLLKNGFVYEPGVKSTRGHLYKYEMEYTTPNSNGRTLRVVLIPCAAENTIKIVTIMFADEVLVSGRR